jgi:hypothetical protein
MNDRSYSKEELIIPILCQYCLADPRYTPIAGRGITRCPVCGAAYSGPRRDRAYQAIIKGFDDATQTIKELLEKDQMLPKDVLKQLGLE